MLPNSRDVCSRSSTPFSSLHLFPRILQWRWLWICYAGVRWRRPSRRQPGVWALWLQSPTSTLSSTALAVRKRKRLSSSPLPYPCNSLLGCAVVSMQKMPVNSLNTEMLQSLSQALAQLEADKCRGFILTSVCCYWIILFATSLKLNFFLRAPQLSSVLVLISVKCIRPHLNDCTCSGPLCRNFGCSSTVQKWPMWH